MQKKSFTLQAAKFMIVIMYVTLFGHMYHDRWMILLKLRQQTYANAGLFYRPPLSIFDYAKSTTIFYSVLAFPTFSMPDINQDNIIKHRKSVQKKEQDNYIREYIYILLFLSISNLAFV